MQTLGTKGSDVYSHSGDGRVDLSVRMVRGADFDDLGTRVRAIAKEHTADAFVMAFHARNVRGGKGERDVGLRMLAALYEDYPALTLDLLDLVPHYGSWSDFRDAAFADNDALQERLAALIAAQLKKDAATPEGESISLAAKWAPREGWDLGKRVARVLFPEITVHSARMRAYRKMVAGLNRRLATVETLMSANDWAAIKPAHVPGRAGRIYKRAFLNLVPNGPHGKPADGQPPDTVRCPNSETRIACADTFRAFYAAAAAGKANIKGATTVFPHEIVKKARHLAYNAPEEEKAYLSGVWRSMVEKACEGGGLGRSIFMSDFSGSMQSAGGQGDTPYWVSMALGILGSQTATGAFRGRMMTFDSTPTWHQFPAPEDGSPADLFACLDTLNGSIGQGLSTDFQAAIDMVLDTLKRERVPPGQEPENIIVLTDMAWDQAAASNGRGAYTGNAYRHHVKTEEWQTHLQMIQESFRRAGEDMWGEGKGWAVPKIIVWNLAASPRDMHATAETPGVGMLSGWSPTQFKVLQLEGPRQITPLEMLRLELDNPIYDQIRERVRATLAPKQAAIRSVVGEGHGDGWGCGDD